MATILIADDEPGIRSLLTVVLRSAGHRVMAAANGVEAVAVFRSYADAIDLAVIDLIMPVMDGRQAIQRIRESRPNVPIICMSGYSEELAPEGGTLFLRKPFLPGELVAAVKKLLEYHEGS
jgi:CheY-like chemotaxis protein